MWLWLTLLGVASEASLVSLLSATQSIVKVLSPLKLWLSRLRPSREPMLTLWRNRLSLLSLLSRLANLILKILLDTLLIGPQLWCSTLAGGPDLSLHLLYSLL